MNTGNKKIRTGRLCDGQWADTSPARLRAALKGYNCGMATEAILDAAQSALACLSKRGGS